MPKASRFILAFLLSSLIIISPSISGQATTSQPFEDAAPSIITNRIPLEDQPFYPQLITISERWNLSYMGEAEGKSPKETLLNFYGIMARTADKIDEVSRRAETEPGLLWNRESRQTIREAEILFASATEALDGSTFPATVRKDKKEETALKLKEILDYSFNNSPTLITIPDSNEVKDWRLPSTGIHLAQGNKESPESHDQQAYFFTAETAENTPKMYDFISRKRSTISKNQPPLSTPNLYNHFTYTPGYLIPPKWYLKLPTRTKKILETPVGDQSILQVGATLIVACVYLPIIYLLTSRFFNTFKRRANNDQNALWLEDNKAWRRLALIAPIPPLSIITNEFLDSKINLTNTWLEKSSLSLDVVTFLSLGLAALLLFEALGRSGSEWILSFYNSQSTIELKRINNIILPSCRLLGGLSSVFVFYALLIRIGLPPSTVLAFSAVPGLAIGLGAQRLLGNLFSGISIQTDRPIRVGDFCKINTEEGYVTKIGLRSIELKTISGKVTIPNSTFDSSIISSYSKQTNTGNDELDASKITQNLELSLEMPTGLGISHLNSIIKRIQDFAESHESLHDLHASFCESSDTKIILTVVASATTLQDWRTYLDIRQELISEIRLIVGLIKNTKQTISVGRQTTPEQLDRIPVLIKEVITQNPLLSMKYCRLSAISEYSLDFTFNMETQHTSISDFLEAIGHLNKQIIQVFADNHIHIPYPTSVELTHNPFSNEIDKDTTIDQSEPQAD